MNFIPEFFFYCQVITTYPAIKLGHAYDMYSNTKLIKYAKCLVCPLK